MNYIVLALFFISTSYSLWGVTDENLDSKPMQILNKSNEYMQSLDSWMCEIHNSTGNSTTEDSLSISRMYIKKNSDGQVFSRNESEFIINKKKQTSLIISNSKGTFFLNSKAKTAIQTNFLEKSKKSMNAASVSGTDNGIGMSFKSVSMEDTTFESFPCYLINVEFSKDQIATTRERSIVGIRAAGLPKSSEETIDKFIAVRTTNIIRKSDYFQISTNSFNSNGEKISGQFYRNIKLNVPLDLDLFEIPNGYSVVKSDNAVDFANAKYGVNKK